MGGHLGKNLVIAASLLAAGFLVAWFRFRPFLGTEGAFTDGERTIAFDSDGELRYAIWETPSPFAGDLNSGENERGPTVSPDGRQLVFVVGERGLGTDLWVCELDDAGRAYSPRPLSEVNGSGDELSPAFSQDGTLLFASNRSGGAGGFDLWRAPWSRGVFGAAEWIGGGLNTRADELDPTPVPGTDELVFASNRVETEGGEVERGDSFNLWQAWSLPLFPGEDAPRYGASSLDELNSEFDERDPCYTLDGRALLFASDREGGSLGQFDLYRASRAPDDLVVEDGPGDGAWLAPLPLSGVNTAASERDPRPSSDGFSLLFSREATGPAGDVQGFDVWRASSKELVRTPGRPVGWRELIVLASLLVLALLAALAKRWRGLDVLYKAFLLSFIAHLLLLLWARDVVPTSEPAELDSDGETRVKVRLVEDPESLSALRNQERSGLVEAERAVETVAAAELQRTVAESERELSDTAATAQAVERSEREISDAPSREELEAPSREPLLSLIHI